MNITPKMVTEQARKMAELLQRMPELTPAQEAPDKSTPQAHESPRRNTCSHEEGEDAEEASVLAELRRWAEPSGSSTAEVAEPTPEPIAEGAPRSSSRADVSLDIVGSRRAGENGEEETKADTGRDHRRGVDGLLPSLEARSDGEVSAIGAPGDEVSAVEGTLWPGDDAAERDGLRNKIGEIAFTR